MSTQQRKERIKQLREEGRLAFEAGKSFESNPYRAKKDEDQHRWNEGWQWARDAERNAFPDDTAVRVLIQMAEQHTEATGEDHGTGDLHEHLYAMWGLLTPEQREQFMALDGTREKYEAGAYESDLDFDEAVEKLRKGEAL